MRKYEQLIVAEQSAELTNDEREFVEVHRRIVASGEMTGRYLFEMCNQIKRMHDNKLYKAAGFKNFEEYSEQALKVKRRQAYNYIKLAETYSEQYIVENSEVGITKLALLASVTDEEREEITETMDIVEANTAEVEEAVKAALQERDEAQKQLKERQEELDGMREELDAAESSKSELQDLYDAKKKELIEAKDKVKTLETSKSNLENQLKAAKAAAEKASKEIKTVPDEESKKQAQAEKARADELEQRLKETTAQLAAAREQKKTIASDDLLTFKIKFNDLQRLGAELKKALDGMNEENATKCRAAVNTVLNGWKGEMKL